MLKGRNGVSTKEICGQEGTSDAMFYNYKTQFGALAMLEAQPARQAAAD